jgi:hypothetical protein
MISFVCWFLVLNACSTIDYTQKKYNPRLWSSSDPFRIPYDIRLQQFEKGNLVKNHSFEQGSVVKGDPENTFLIKGWKTVGPNVKWVNTESERFTAEEVSDGKHAVKIVRKKANELDEAEGLTSDFISVIPGNYTFTYTIKLRNIVGNKYRLGVKLYDAVVIKVLFYDACKQPLDSGRMNPVSKSRIDNSDKGYSFSNFWAIDDFPWGTVRGRTYNYPFSEGDIPDQTRYVRLFFGLKGTGSMWLDHVVFRYSKWNFTTLERFKPYFDRELSLAERIIPTPKHFQWLNDIAFYDTRKSDSLLPLIVLPENPAPAERTAAKILQEKINTILGKFTDPHTFKTGKIKKPHVRRVDRNFEFDDFLNSRLVFSIGRNKVYQKVKPELSYAAIRNKRQGYIIKPEKVGNTYIVFLAGEAPLGSFYAATTAIQLFADDKCVYHNATVTDYPDFFGRSYGFKNWKNSEELQKDLDTMDRMSLYKLNKVYFGYKRTDKNWHQPDELYLQGTKEAGRRCRESGVMSLAVMINPYSHLGFEAAAENISDQLRSTWTHSSPESFKMLQDLYRIGLEAGADTIMLRADDYVPHYGKNRQHYALYDMNDKKRFVNLQNAQAYVINNLKQWIDNHYRGIRLEFCPPWYSNEHIDRSHGKAEGYFKDLTLQIPRDVAIIWTGPTIRSLSIDSADLFRYKSLIGRWPMIWDNTLYARNLETKKYGGYPAHYPGKVRMCNLFEPFDTYRPEGFQNLNDGRQMYTNGAAYSEIYKIKFATVADYQWNTKAYSPELALWKVLCNSYGPQNAKQLLQFNDAYYRVYDVCLRMKTAGAKTNDINMGQTYLKEMANTCRTLSVALPGQDSLLNELENFLDKQKKRLENVSQVQKK